MQLTEPNVATSQSAARIHARASATSTKSGSSPTLPYEEEFADL
jgi:hypothetical protein